MKPCNRCGGAGFTTYETQRDGKFFPVIQQCCDVAKYSAEIRRRHSLTYEAIEKMGAVHAQLDFEQFGAKVIPFRGET